jgi:hypothetical protein
MPGLREFQRDFADSILQPQPTGFALSADNAFAVYRNSWLSAALDALAANYPTVAALLGPELFKTVAVDHARISPPVSPVLADYGGHFPDFLGRSALAPEYPYLADVAGLERLWTQSYFAPEDTPWSLDKAARLAPPDLLSTRVSMRQSARLGQFATPAVAIWHAHQQGGGFDSLEPEWRSEQALVIRNETEVLVHLVDDPAFQFLAALQQTGNFGDAADTLLRRHPGADLASVFAWALLSGAVAAPVPMDKGLS